MKLKDVYLCPDLDCNEVYTGVNSHSCPRCLSPEGISLAKVLTKIEELSQVVYRERTYKSIPIKKV